ncbi:MAG: 2-dehydro-3-deoxygalactonokinase [Pseudomonadota bacterium]
METWIAGRARNDSHGGLIAVDWGTSSLRAALLDEQGAVVEERSAPRGILSVPAGGFPDVFDEITANWPRGDGTLCLVSGMAGSRQGWIEAPYCACPAGFSEIAANLAWVEPERIAIVPGMSCERDGVPDVMRGEETQVFGAMAAMRIDTGWFVLPGTHSKWVRAVGGRIEHFSTFMTGEFYALLRQHSILARTLPEADGELDAQAFERGVKHAATQGNLLHAAFSVRALALFDRMPAHAMPSYLSGLVIGEEVRTQRALLDGTSPVVLVGSAALAKRYSLALGILGVSSTPAPQDATWQGLRAIASECRLS